MNGTETSPTETVTVQEGETITGDIPSATPKTEKLIIELTNLAPGIRRTVKRDLKVLIEDYGYRKMINDCIQVRDEGVTDRGLWVKRYRTLIKEIQKDIGERAAEEYNKIGMEVSE